MRESDTYLAIMDEGRQEQAKEDILFFGERRFGPPDESVKSAWPVSTTWTACAA